MKKLLIITNLFWVSIFIFFACTKPIQVTSIDCCKMFCYDGSNQPFAGLSYKAAEKMANLYKQNHLPKFQADMTAPNNLDARSVWFSLATIKKFIYEIDRNACQSKCPEVNQNTLGIRFYFGEYPQKVASDPLFSGVPNKYSGLHTLFMVPTYWDAAMGDNMDYDPRWNLQAGGNRCKPTSLSDFKKDAKNKEFLAKYMMVVAAPEPNGMQNHGNLCPPDHCPGMSF